MDSLRLDSWGLGWNVQRLFFSFFFFPFAKIVEGKAREGKGREIKVVYVTYTIFSKIPMMTDDDDDEKRKRRGE